MPPAKGELAFLKVEGTKNDFVLLDAGGPVPASLSALSPMLCDRRSGVGADGVLVAQGGPQAFMRMWNPDGSEAENCGNGLRCVAAWLHQQGRLDQNWLTVQTRGGPVELAVGDTTLAWYRVRFPAPELQGDEPAPMAEDTTWTRVRVGNPHAVIRCENVQAVPVESLGAAAQDVVAGGVNVEWAEQRGASRFAVRIFERGAGETMSCGSGVTAVAAAAWARGWSDSAPIDIDVPGGQVRVSKDGDRVVLSGPARICYRGSFPWSGPVTRLSAASVKE